MILHITVNKNRTCNVSFIDVISKVIIRNVFYSIVIVSRKQRLSWERPVMNKHCSLFGPLVNYDREKFCNIGTRGCVDGAWCSDVEGKHVEANCQGYKLFFFVADKGQ
jgi:hypothetical protein